MPGKAHRRAGARASSALLIAFAVALVAGSSARAASGDLDPSFGSNGTVLIDIGFGSHDQAFAVAIQPDGKIVAAGSSDSGGGDFALVRYRTDGGLDTTFGSGGKVLTDLGSNSVDAAFGVAVQPDGKIVAVGHSRAVGIFDYSLALVRYNADGSLDSGFGADGKVLAHLGAGSSDELFGVTIQPDGKIVAAGISFIFSVGRGDFAVVRYHTDGSPDSSFGTGGKTLTDLGTASFDLARAIAIQPDGRLLAAGHTNAGGGLDFALVRHNPDGSLDSGFGTGGTVQTDVGAGSVDDAYAIAIQPDGKLVVAGISDASGTDFALVRYHADGSIDLGFGTGGRVLTDLGSGSYDETYGVAIQADGKIVAAGRGGGDFALVRYNADGSLDSSFGSGGKVLTGFGIGTFDQAHAVAIQPDGKIVAVGISQAFDNRDFAVARYVADPTAMEQLEQLIALVTGLGPGTSLADKLHAAKAALARSDLQEACEKLQAFSNQVHAQSGRTLTSGQAAQLIAAADRIRGTLDC